MPNADAYLTDADRRRIQAATSRADTARVLREAAEELEASLRFEGKLTKGGKRPMTLRVGNKGPRTDGKMRMVLEHIPYDLTKALTVGMLTDLLGWDSARASAALVYWHRGGKLQREKRSDPATRSINRKEQWYYWRVR